MSKNSSSQEQDLNRLFSLWLELWRSYPQMLETMYLVAQSMAVGTGMREMGVSSTQGRESSQIMQALMRANTATWSNGLRYWTRCQELCVRRMSAMGRDAVGTERESDDALHGASADQVRAYLRELSELSFDQCRLLRRDLEQIEMELFAVEQDEHPRRRWKAKQ